MADMVRLQNSIPAEVSEALDQLAEQTGMSRSATVIIVLRLGIQVLLEKNQKLSVSTLMPVKQPIDITGID